MKDKIDCYMQAPNGLIWPMGNEQVKGAKANGFVPSTKKRYKRQIKYLTKLKKIADRHKMTITQFFDKTKDEKWLEKKGYALVRDSKGTLYLQVSHIKTVKGKSGFNSMFAQRYRISI